MTIRCDGMTMQIQPDLHFDFSHESKKGQVNKSRWYGKDKSEYNPSQKGLHILAWKSNFAHERQEYENKKPDAPVPYEYHHPSPSPNQIQI